MAEDLTGDLFVRMVTALPRYRPMRATFRAWLYRIAHNLVMDHYRRESNHRLAVFPDSEAHADMAEPLDAFVERKLTFDQVQAALPSLEPLQREAVTLRFLSGLSLQEAAAVMGMTEAAIKALQHRGLSAMRTALAKESARDG